MTAKEKSSIENKPEEESIQNSKEEQIAKVLSDPTKKRKAEDEIEIDLNQSVPLSKKQKRLLRRGKVTIEELNKKFNIDPSSIEEYKKESDGKATTEEVAETSENDDSKSKVKKEKKFGVWVGNLSFDTSKEDLIRFIVAKTKDLEGESKVEEDSIIRVNLPLAQNDGKKIRNKGFAYMDFKNKEQMNAVIGLSESQLNGRNMLIKNSSSYEGRPDKNDLIAMSKNPPSRILFVGNLSFDTTDELLRKHFQHCGEIVKVRMATFQDSGKCKGFAFIDFKDEKGPTEALTDKSCRKIAGRPLRMEFGEDRSKRQVKRRENSSQYDNNRKPFDISNATPASAPTPVSTVPIRERRPKTSRPQKPSFTDSNNRLKSSIALASAQRASAAIVPSQGKKTTF